MARGVLLSESEKKSIIDLSKKSLSHREIARQIKRSKTSVTNFLKNSSKNRIKKRCGPKNKIDNRTKRLIFRAVSNKQVSCKRIINDLNLKVSRWTVNRLINKSDYIRHKKKKQHLP